MATVQSLERDVRQPVSAPTSFNVWQVREDFPILNRRVHGKPLVYLDNAATTQKPQAVIDAMSTFYAETNANVHRGVHILSKRATSLYENARLKVKSFINAADSCEVIFVRGATEGINLVAQTFGHQRVKAGDEIIISAMEHHSNIIPWQMLCEEKGARLRVIPMNDNGELLLEQYETMVGPRTRLVAVTHVSNSLGTINATREIIDTAHRRGVPVLVDGAQAAPHLSVDVRELDCDFYVFSGHKLYGPTGIGVLWGKKELLDAMPPYQSGGDMVSSFTFEKTTLNRLPYKFEAGTPNIAGAVGLGAAIDYLNEIDLQSAVNHEHELLSYATEALSAVPGLRIIGSARKKAAVISFVVDGLEPHDIGSILDGQGIAVRTGHHCCQPVMERFAVPATTRISFGLYNTFEEIDAAVEAIYKVKEMLPCGQTSYTNCRL